MSGWGVFGGSAPGRQGRDCSTVRARAEQASGFVPVEEQHPAAGLLVHVDPPAVRMEDQVPGCTAGRDGYL